MRQIPGLLVISLLFSAAAFGATGASPSPPEGWLTQVRQQIATEEYQVTWQPQTLLADLDAAWHAPNRAQGFRIYFTEEGIRVVPRDYAGPAAGGEMATGGGVSVPASADASDAGRPPWEWRLELAGYGRGGTTRAVAAPRLGPSGSRVDYDRGAITEWYANGPRGLEQGFMLRSAPENSGGMPTDVTEPRGPRSAPVSEKERANLVHLDLRLGGTLTPSIATDGQSVDFRTGRGANVVHYAELKVTDAGGKELPAWIEGFSGAGFGGVRIVLDDTDAVYPVIVDPLATNPAWTAESDQASAYFGCSVATAGDVNADGYADVIVGAYYYDNGETDEGRAYVYHGSASGLATTAAWTAESDQASAHFGISVATAGDVNGDGYADVIVGAYRYDNVDVNEGRAYVYHGSSSGLAATAAWTAESDQAHSYFGRSVSTAGDVNGDGYADVIVGAYRYSSGPVRGGRAFVFHGSASGLSPSASWTMDGDQDGANIGLAVATAGDVDGDGYADVILGASAYDNGQTDEGRAYLFRGSASGLEATPAWTAESDQAGAEFGVSVGSAGDVDGDGYADVIVGADRFDENGLPDEGRTFVYHGSASGPKLTADWTVEGGQGGALLGHSVGAAGDVNGDGYADVIVGAHSYDNGETDEGRALVYYGSAVGLSTTPAWTAESDQVSASFGWSVGSAGDVNGDGYSDVIVGADAYDNGEANEGRAYVYGGSAAGLSTTAGWTAEGNQASAEFGYSVGTAGDVNGDGYGDVIVGALYYDNGEVDEGRVWVYHGSSSGLEAAPSWSAEGNQPSALFGVSSGTAGDVNGDGYSDVIIGAEAFTNDQTDEGRAYIYHGSPSGLAGSPSWTAEGDQASAYFGVSVATAGDVNGDGYSDVIVGAANYTHAEEGEGRAFVYHGSAAGVSATPDWTAESNQKYASFGLPVASAGDVNGDGYSDVIVGCYQCSNGQTIEGQAYVYHGSSAGLSLSHDWVVESNQESSQFGRAVGTAGDVNGDGFADVIVGAYKYSNGQTEEGRTFVYHGSAVGLASSAAWTAEGDQDGAAFGDSVASLGDVNGDGYADVIVGAYGFDNGQADEGRVFVYHGSASGLAVSPAWTAESDQDAAYMGVAVGSAGDVDGDGYADAIVAATYYDNGESEEGRAYLFYGNDGPGLSLRPEQRRADDSAPIGRVGRARSSDGFRLAALGRSPFGRTRVKLEWETKARGVPLDGTGTTSSTAYVDTGTAGAQLSELVSGLEPGDYHWRVRLHYDPAGSPFAQSSRWFTMPWSGQDETDLSLAHLIGGVVWLDDDGDGIRQPGEAMLDAVTVELLDSGGALLDQALTNGAGEYHFEVSPGLSYRIRFLAPSGHEFTLKDQGSDDTLDSDADPVTGETDLISPPHGAFDFDGWSAGTTSCTAPAQAVSILSVRKDGSGNPILDIQDPNLPGSVTGYNVYRSDTAGLPPDQWSLIGSDVADEDPGTPDVQWTDTTGDASPTGAWFYQAAAYNNGCDAEGPR